MGNCVQIGSEHGLVAVVGRGHIALHFTPTEFSAFLAGVKAGESSAFLAGVKAGEFDDFGVDV